MKDTFGLYIRGEAYSQSERNQREIINSYGINLKTSKCIEFIETNHRSKREAFEALIVAIKSDEVSTLVVSQLDRLDLVASTLLEFLDFFEILSTHNVRFISIIEGIDSNEPAGVFLKRLNSAILKAREVIRGEKIHLALKDSKEKGNQLGRPRTVNYETILSLRKEGDSIQSIADRMGVSRGAVQHCLKTQPLV